MFKINALLALLATICVATAAPTERSSQLMGTLNLDPLPAGSADGVYFGTKDANENTVWTMNEELSRRSEEMRKRDLDAGIPTGTSSMSKRGGDYVGCNNYGIEANDANTAQGMLANIFGGGFSWNAHVISQSYQTGQAYGCNYGNGQSITSSQFWGYMANINGVCGFASGSQAGAGWYEIPDWKSAYGRGSSGTGVC